MNDSLDWRGHDQYSYGYWVLPNMMEEGHRRHAQEEGWLRSCVDKLCTVVLFAADLNFLNKYVG